MSPLPPTKYGGTFFKKKLFMGEETFLGKFFLGMFYMENNDQIMQGRKLIVKRFQRSSQVFPLIDPDLGY